MGWNIFGVSDRTPSAESSVRESRSTLNRVQEGQLAERGLDKAEVQEALNQGASFSEILRAADQAGA